METVGEFVYKYAPDGVLLRGVVIVVYRHQQQYFAKIEYDDRSEETVTLQEAERRVKRYASDMVEDILFTNSSCLHTKSIDDKIRCSNSEEKNNNMIDFDKDLGLKRKIIDDEDLKFFNLSANLLNLKDQDKQQMRKPSFDINIKKGRYINNIFFNKSNDTQFNAKKRVKQDIISADLYSNSKQNEDLKIEKSQFKEICPVIEILAKYDIGAQVYFPQDWQTRPGSCDPHIKKSIPRPAKTIRYLVQSGLTKIGEKIVYCGGHGKVMAEGWIASSGILCARCGYIIGSTEFEKCAGMRVRKPGKHIMFKNGRSLLELTRLLNQISDSERLKNIYNTA